MQGLCRVQGLWVRIRGTIFLGGVRGGGWWGGYWGPPILGN